MKPENLLIFRDLSVKIGDFGISMKLPDNSPLTTMVSDLKGFTDGYSTDEFVLAC